MQNLIRLTRDLQFGPLQMSQNTRISPGTNFSKISREFFFDFFVIKIIRVVVHYCAKNITLSKS